MTIKREYWLDALYLVAGSVLYAVSVVMFAAPNHIAPGGVTGLATLAQYLWGAPIGTVTILLNLPLLLVSWRRLGRPFLVRTLFGLALSSLTIDLLDPLLPAYRGETLLVCLFGGAICGLAIGLIMTRGGTTGGTEIAARLIELKFPHIPIGKLLLTVDGAVILLSGLVYRDVDSALYATVYAFISSLMMDKIVYGGRRGKMALIATSQPQEVTQRIISELSRGVTLLHADGGYTGKEQRLLLCAVRGEEAYALRQLVFSQDSAAFVMLLSTDEVRGMGFLHPHTR